jgi:very-short-patch-repair endonuclease
MEESRPTSIKESSPVRESRRGSYMNADPMEYGLLKAYARENRKNMTQSESILWSQIRGKALGVTFLRQYIIGDYITDFACLEPKLVIEVDGGYHSEPRQVEDDAIRQDWLEHQGFKVIRFTNEEVECDINNTINKIKQALDLPKSSLREEASSLLSRRGREDQRVDLV